MEFEISNEDPGDTREVDPFVSTLPNGNILVGWTQFAASQTGGRATGLRVIQPDGTPVTGEFFPAGLDPTGDRLDPEIVVISDTTFILIEAEFFFNDLGGGNFEFGFNIFGRVITESGGTLSSGPQVDLTPAGFASNGNIDVTMTDNGNIVVASDLTDDLVGNTDPIVSIAVLDQNLNILTGFTQVSERDTSSPSRVTIDAVGNDVAVSWTQNSVGNTNVPLLGQTVTINADGSIAPFTRTDHVLRDGGDDFGLHDMATLSNGNILVIYGGGPNANGSLTDGDRLFGTVFSSDFTTVVQSTFRIDQIDSDFGIAGAHIAPLAGGGFFVTYSRALNADGSNPNFEAWYRVYDNTYTANGNEVRLTNQTMDISDVTPEATLLSDDGDILVVWQQGPRLTSTEDIFGITLNNLDPNPVGVNTAPVVDLNGAGGGINNTAAFNEGSHQGLGVGNGIQIAPTGTLSDADAGDNVDTVTFTLADDQDGALEQLFVDPTALTGGVTVSGNGSDTLTISRNAATQALLQTALQAVRWQNNSDNPDTTNRTINVVANDGDDNSVTAVATVTVARANDASTASGIPTDITVVEDTASNADLSAITFADVDGDNLTVTLGASAGTLAATSGGGVTVGGSATGTLTLAGTAAAINTFLDTTSNIQYTGALNASGNDAATVTVNANDGTVNPLLGTINVDIAAVNDAPTASGIPTDITVVEDTASNADLSAITFADVDGDNLTVTLGASAGTLAATSGGGVTVGGSATGTLTLAGTAAAINTFLDTTSNIQYTGALNANGNDAATVTVNANDGTVNPLLGTINVDITAVNDAPVIAGDLAAAVSEGGTVTITTTDLSENDPDDDGTGLTYTVTGTTNGQMELSRGANIPITLFTQDDLDNNVIVFRHDGSETIAASFTVTLADGGEDGAGTAGPATVNLNVTPVDDPADAVDDAFATDEATPIGAGLSVFNANPATADSDVDSPLQVTQVNGNAAAFGVQTALASGALLTLNPDGTFVYDPNGAFAALPDFTVSGASNTSTTDSFTYQLNGDDTATVTVTINGVDSTGDMLFGTAGADTLIGGTGGDAIDGGGGVDLGSYETSLSSVLADLLLSSRNTGDAAGDSYTSIENLRGTDFDDVLLGNDDANEITGQMGNDRLVGRGGDDQLFGGLDNDTLIGGVGSDLLDGGAGIDTASYEFATTGVRADLPFYGQNMGGATGDVYVAVENLTGSASNDVLRGDAGDNFLSSLAGNDRLFGREGSDTLFGSFGADRLAGGLGGGVASDGAADTFLYTNISQSTANGLTRDTIIDFSRADGDIINLSRIDANTAIAGDQAFTFIGNTGFSGTAGQLRFAAPLNQVQGDINGDGITDFAVVIENMPNMLASDFDL